MHDLGPLWENKLISFVTDNSYDAANPNRKVNLLHSLATERGAKHVIIDVSRLNLDKNMKLEHLFALKNFYSSDFWIEYKSIGIVTWFFVSLIITLYYWYDYGKK